MKKYFIPGLVVLLPVALTTAIVLFIFNLLTNPFAGVLKEIFNRYHLFHNGFLFLNEDQVNQYASQILILIFLFFFTVALGKIGRWFFVHYLIRISEKLFAKIPLVNTIYKTCKDVIKTIFASKSKSFKQVVLVRFPNPETYSIGLVTKDSLPSLSSSTSQEHVCVFVPTTPNPTSGFMVIFDKRDVIFLDMKVEDAFKYIISCGVITTPFHQTDSHPLPDICENEENEDLLIVEEPV